MKQLINAFDYACYNSYLVVNDFIHSGITQAFSVSISQSPLRDDDDVPSSNEEAVEEQSSDEEENQEQ